MKAILAITLLCASLTPQKCSQPVPPPADVPSAPALKQDQAANLSKIGAAANAQVKALAAMPESNEKKAAEGENSVIKARAGAVTPADQAEADARVIAGLNGDLATAQKSIIKALEQAGSDQTRISTLEKQVQDERMAAAIELQRQLDTAHSEAARKEQLLISGLLFGLGALCIIAAFLIGQMAVTIPQFGPRAATGFGLAGGTLIAIGIGLRVVNRMLDEHPYVFWGSLLFAILAVVVAGALIYANHKHHVTALLAPAAS